MTQQRYDAALRRRLAAFPGIAAGSRVARPAAGAEAAFVFDAGRDGEIARLLLAHVMRRAKAKPCPPSEGRPADACYRVDERQTAALARSLDYASERILAPAPSAGRASPAATTLPALLSHALVAFTCDYATPDDRTPSLPVWSNVLRAIEPDGTEQRRLAQRAVMSRRSLGVVLEALEQIGWLAIRKHPTKRGGRIVRLTAAGSARERAARARIKAVEQAWRKRFGAPRMDALRRSLAAICGSLELELPYYITGYGVSDPSLTGGSYRAAEPGPPRLPARGQEWPTVPRDAAVDAAALPLSALLSQALAEFTLDYEGEQLGSLAWASMFLRHVPDEGIPLARAKPLGGGDGNGKSGPERHLCVVIEPGKTGDGNRTVYLTPKSRRVRDAYPTLVAEIEARWRTRFGSATMRLRDALEAIDRELPPGLPDYPDTNTWLLGHLVRANWMLRDATERPIALAWHAGQRQRARPAEPDDQPAA